MPIQEHCSVEYLAEVFGQCQEEIVSEWRARAQVLLQELKLDQLTIINHLADLVAEIIQDLALNREAAVSLGLPGSAGTLGERGFADQLLRLEHDKARPHGFTITASNTYDDWTVVLLRLEGAREPRAAFEFLPGGNVFRPTASQVRL